MSKKVISGLAALCMEPISSIRQAITSIDQNQKGIVLVIDQEGKLINTITDGDVRRAMLAGHNLDAPVSELLSRKVGSLYPKPITARIDTESSALLLIMQEHRVRQLPLLDANERVAGLVTMDELLPPDEVLPLEAVIMAGGFGTRLRPLTEDLPKPMLPVGGRPLMAHIVEQLRQAGIRRVSVTTHYKPDKIMEHFGDGQAFGVELKYVNEDRPLGTAGALGLLNTSSEPLLVINGDILTQVNFRAMLSYHKEHEADMTVAVRRYDLHVPYGVIDCDGPLVRRVTEKPVLNLVVNAGIYLLEPAVHRYIPDGRSFNMTDLVDCLLKENRRVASFLVREYWLDIGHHADYVRAQEDHRDRRFET